MPTIQRDFSAGMQKGAQIWTIILFIYLLFKLYANTSFFFQQNLLEYRFLSRVLCPKL